MIAIIFFSYQTHKQLTNSIAIIKRLTINFFFSLSFINHKFYYRALDINRKSWRHNNFSLVPFFCTIKGIKWGNLQKRNFFIFMKVVLLFIDDILNYDWSSHAASIVLKINMLSITNNAHVVWDFENSIINWWIKENLYCERDDFAECLLIFWEFSSSFFIEEENFFLCCNKF